MTAHTKPSAASGGRDTSPPVESESLEVERALRGSSHCGLRRVRCSIVDGSVTLSGEVASFYLKQIAQTIVGRLPQVRQVKNELHVVGIESTRFDS